MTPDVFYGAVAPLMVVAISWFVIKRAYLANPAGLMGILLAGMIVKLIFFAAYAVVMLRAMHVRPIPFVASFSVFAVNKGFEQMRVCAAYGRSNLKVVGTHSGISIGEDGPSQMALEDIAALRAVHGSTVLHPCDANQTAKLVERMADTEGIVYLRTLRPNTPVIYGPDEDFEIGGSRTVRQGDDVAIVGAGITVHEALKAAETLAKEGIEARVLDLYSIKPLDAETLRSLTCPIVTVEDHWAEGGLGEAVLSALGDADDRPPVVRLAVREMPHSGKPAELLAEAGIDADGIAAAARSIARAHAGA